MTKKVATTKNQNKTEIKKQQNSRLKLPEAIPETV